MTIKYVRNLFGKEKYVSEFICYQKVHFCTPVILKGGIVWHTIIHQTIPGVYFVEGGGIFLPFTPVSTLTFIFSTADNQSPFRVWLLALALLLVLWWTG